MKSEVTDNDLLLDERNNGRQLIEIAGSVFL